MKKDDCIFCKIANGEIPSKTLYEDDSFRVILDISPASKAMPLFCLRIMLQTFMNCQKKMLLKSL